MKDDCTHIIIGMFDLALEMNAVMRHDLCYGKQVKCFDIITYRELTKYTRGKYFGIFSGYSVSPREKFAVLDMFGKSLEEK